MDEERVEAAAKAMFLLDLTIRPHLSQTWEQFGPGSHTQRYWKRLAEEALKA